MAAYSFTVTLSGVDALTPEISDALFEAGINGDDDTLVGSSCGALFIDFELEAASLAVAVASAIGRVEKAGYKVAKVEIDEPAAAGLMPPRPYAPR